jgi:NTP pyrophosphatase (non-canonical NTP hydrolase)
MDFDFIRQAVIENADDYEKRFGVKIDKEFALLKLVEEVGEYMQAVLIHERKCRPEKFLEPEKSKDEVAKELADVVGMAIVNAKLQGIDLEAALQKKWIKNRQPAN